MLKKVISDWLTSVWYDRSRPPAVLRALVPLYRYAQSRRVGLAQHEGGADPSVPVIVVGNLVVGGSGKTPVVSCVVQACLEAGHRVAIVARGYGGRHQAGKKAGVLLVRSDTDPALAGDEPVLLAKQTGVDVWVGQDRQVAVASAVAAGAEAIVCDDGLQHPRLKSTYTLCLIDGARGFGNGYLLPAGPLRESPKRLDRVDQILIKGGGLQLGQAHTCFELRAKDLFCVGTSEKLGVMALKGQRVQALAAIAHPESFRISLEALGMKVDLSAWPDHHAFSEQEIIHAHRGGPMVVTEKDWVKIERLDLPETLKQNLYVLQIEAQVDSAVLDAVVSHVREFKHHG